MTLTINCLSVVFETKDVKRHALLYPNRVLRVVRMGLWLLSRFNIIHMVSRLGPIQVSVVSRGVDSPPFSASAFFFSLTPHCSSVTVAIGISFSMNEHTRPTPLTTVIASQTRLRLSANASSTGGPVVRTRSLHGKRRGFNGPCARSPGSSPCKAGMAAYAISAPPGKSIENSGGSRDLSSFWRIVLPIVAPQT